MERKYFSIPSRGGKLVSGLRIHREKKKKDSVTEIRQIGPLTGKGLSSGVKTGLLKRRSLLERNGILHLKAGFLVNSPPIFLMKG
jgi:hypothetical protein